MTRSIAAFFILLLTVFASSSAAQSVDTVEELKICASIADQEARLACFDELGERVLREESAVEETTHDEVAEPEAATATTTDVQPLPDELGSSKTARYTGLITSCKKGHYGDWYFFFDNGQVWKEVNDRRLRFKDCNFNATITKDGFGYKMRIDGEKKTIRVRRHR